MFFYFAHHDSELFISFVSHILLTSPCTHKKNCFVIIIQASLLLHKRIRDFFQLSLFIIISTRHKRKARQQVVERRLENIFLSLSHVCVFVFYSMLLSAFLFLRSFLRTALLLRSVVLKKRRARRYVIHFLYQQIYFCSRSFSFTFKKKLFRKKCSIIQQVSCYFSLAFFSL